MPNDNQRTALVPEASREITGNVVAPGPTELFLHGQSDALLDRLRGMNPFGRLGEPDDIAGAVAFFVGPGGAWVNGQVLRANGRMA